MKKKTVYFITKPVMVIIVMANDKRSRVKPKEQHIFSLRPDQIVEFIRFTRLNNSLLVTTSDLDFVQRLSVKTWESIFCSDMCKRSNNLHVVVSQFTAAVPDRLDFSVVSPPPNFSLYSTFLSFFFLLHLYVRVIMPI